MSLRQMIETIRYSQSGNVFFALFGAVALVGVVGASSMQIMKGPVRSMSEVTKRTVAENNMIASAKLALIAATSQSDSGDCDADGYVEPIPFEASATGAPTGGGHLPAAIGAAMNDPWDTRYGYCVWDHGAITAGCGGGNYLTGENGATGYAIAVISAGPDRQFQTACNAYPSAAALDKTPGTDDIVLGYTYGEASALAGGLWNLKSGDAETAEINRNLEVKDESGNVTFALDAQSGLGDFIGLTTGSIAGKSGPLDITGGLKFESDSIALNAACTEEDSFAFDTATDMLVRCDGSIWVPSGGSDNLGNHEATENIQLKGFWLSKDGGDEGLQVADDGVLTTSGDITVGNDLTTTAAATVGTTLDVTGNSTLSTVSTSGLATLNSASVTQNAGVGGTLNVTGGTTLSSLTTTGAAQINSATIDTTLGVTGATSLSTLSTSGLSTLNALAVTANASVGGTLDMTAGKISNLLDPTLAQDAASKAYVDARVASGTGFTEADPQVGTIQSTKWCVGNNDGSAIVCDQNMPVPNDTLAGLSCGSGQVPKWNGTAWACAADNSGGGGGASVAFSVNKGGTNQTVTNGALTLLTWSTERFDTNSNFASNRFTPTVAGEYFINLAVGCSAGNEAQALIYKNGVATHFGMSARATNAFGSVNAIIEMNGSTDYLEAYGSCTGTTVYGAATNTFFEGALIGGGGSTTGRIVSTGGLAESQAMATATSSLGAFEARSLGTGGTAGAAFLAFHRPGAYAVYFGLDTDNQLKIGGWSMGAVAHKVWHGGNDGTGSTLDADLLDGQDSAFYRDASNLNAGTVAAARMPALTGDVTMTAGTTVTNIAANAVTTAEIAADTIAAADIAPNAVTSSELADSAVTIAKLSATGTPSATTYLRGDNTWATPVAGDTLLPGSMCGIALGVRNITCGSYQSVVTCNGASVATSAANCPAGYTKVDGGGSSDTCIRTCAKN